MSAVRPGTGWSALHPSETSPTGAIEAAKSYRKERNTVPASPYFRSLLEQRVGPREAPELGRLASTG
jgi:hypothetical protein